MRAFEKTHPWLQFQVDLRDLDAFAWMKLGECQSKCEHIAGVPLRPDVARELHMVYLSKGARATVAIEGNTLTEDQVRQKAEGHLDLPPSQEYLGQEVDNVIRLCHEIARRIHDGSLSSITPGLIQEFNAGILQGLEVPDDVRPGEYREHSVGVARYLAAPAEDVPHLVERLCQWIESDTFRPPDPEATIAVAILKAIVAHLYIAWIHPFGDGNGRTARLVEFTILLVSGVPAPAAHLLSNHYNETRRDYYLQLDRASASGGDPVPFIGYAIRGLVDQLRMQLSRIRDQQWDVTWSNYVHERFRETQGEAARRRRRLVLALSSQEAPVTKSELMSLTPAIAKDYAQKTDKTLARDLNNLLDMELVKKSGRGFIANKELILAYLPFRAGATQGG